MGRAREGHKRKSEDIDLIPEELPAPCRVLIAEDDPVSCRVLQAHLSKWGYEVVVTTNGSDAWAALQANDAPRLAVLDWMMPLMDGPEVIERLREGAKEYVYVILL
ncbi:MAG: response regulator, partial [Terriglobia bacterium]